MISAERIKNAYKSYLSYEEVMQSDLYTEEELHAVSFVYKAERYIHSRAVSNSFDAYEQMYMAGARTREDYEKRIGLSEITPENEFTAMVYKSILSRSFNLNIIRDYLYNNFDTIFNEEGFNEVRKEADVRRRH